MLSQFNENEKIFFFASNPGPPPKKGSNFTRDGKTSLFCHLAKKAVFVEFSTMGGKTLFLSSITKT
jgi:hypothetical protein